MMGVTASVAVNFVTATLFTDDVTTKWERLGGTELGLRFSIATEFPKR